MSMRYIRDYYGVPAKRGARIRWTHHLANVPQSPAEGTIVAAKGQYLRVRFDADGKIRTLHPTWAIEYLSMQDTAGGEQ